jgi:hypothetical protein
VLQRLALAHLNGGVAMMKQQQGLIAILDALGAANYSDPEIKQFLESRGRVLNLLNARAEKVLGDMDASRVTTFTFNDTVVVVYRTHEPAALTDVRAFCTLLRLFEINSLANGILFRGAISIGSFYVDDATNTVMGRAVTDAAAWYNQADWIGITATPYATLLIKSLIAQGGEDLAHLMVDYAVPLKDQSSVILKAVNWPKAFYVKGLRPCADGENPRAKCLALLAKQGVPKGAESKHFNSLAFFDHCVKLWRKQSAKK